MDDLLQWLKRTCSCNRCRTCETRAALESSQARIAELEGALKPFAERAEYFDGKVKACGDDWKNDDTYCDDPPTDIYLAQLRVAKTTLSRTPSQSLDRARKVEAVIEAARTLVERITDHGSDMYPEHCDACAAMKTAEAALAALDIKET